tara:strand:+ start:539 stop:1867 length:1329 start_codon:yes stop_codon:yes gene_type:complete
MGNTATSYNTQKDSDDHVINKDSDENDIKIYKLLSYKLGDPPKVKVLDKFAEDVYTTKKVIGEGSFGKIVLLQAENGKQLAAKIPLKYEPKQDRDDMITAYLKVLKDSKYPKNCGILNVQLAHGSSSTPIFIMDYFPAGDLFGIMEKGLKSGHNKTSDEIMTLYVTQISAQLECLIAHDLFYIDLKLENVLVKFDDDGLKFVLADTASLMHANCIGPVKGSEHGCGIIRTYINPYAQNTVDANAKTVRLLFGLTILMVRYFCKIEYYETLFLVKSKYYVFDKESLDGLIALFIKDAGIYQNYLKKVMIDQEEFPSQNVNFVSQLFAGGHFHLGVLKYACVDSDIHSKTSLDGDDFYDNFNWLRLNSKTEGRRDPKIYGSHRVIYDEAKNWRKSSLPLEEYKQKIACILIDFFTKHIENPDEVCLRPAKILTLDVLKNLCQSE